MIATFLAALRSLLYVLFLIITVIPWGIAVQLIGLFARGNPVYWACANWLHVSILGARYICGVRWRIQGLENLPKNAAGDYVGAVLLSKHQSTWEALAYPALMPNPLAYVFKRELLYIPFFGWSMARMDMIHINRARRSEAWRQVAAQGRRMTEMGHWVIMFPEGTRIARGQKGEYKTGGTRLAIEAGVPVVPIAATAARCWPRKSFLLRPGMIDISVGKPIPSVGREPIEMMREVEAWIETEMRRLDPEAYAPEAAAPGRVQKAGT